MASLRGTICFGEYESQRHPDPEVSKLRVHPLAQVLETPAGLAEMPTCKTCKVLAQCKENQCAGLGFADPRCEMPVSKRGYGARLSVRLSSVYDMLQDREPMTVMQIADELGKTKHYIRDIIEDLQNRGLVVATDRISDGQYKRNVYAVAPNNANP